jgi:hypothetical protein
MLQATRLTVSFASGLLVGLFGVFFVMEFISDGHASGAYIFLFVFLPGLFAGWAITTYAISRGSPTIAVMWKRGGVLGAVEWLCFGSLGMYVVYNPIGALHSIAPWVVLTTAMICVCLLVSFFAARVETKTRIKQGC